MSVAFVDTSMKTMSMVLLKINMRIGRVRIAAQKLICLRRKKSNNGSKLLGKGILDVGSTPTISTKSICPPPLQQCTWWLSYGDDMAFDRVSNRQNALER